jgi:cytochrome c-type biogenesis protein CcmH
VAIRQYVDHAVARGESDRAIESYLVSRYGPSVLLNPPASGVTALVWILPLAVVAAAAVGLAFAFRRRTTPAAAKGPSFNGEGALSGHAVPGTPVGQ